MPRLALSVPATDRARDVQKDAALQAAVLAERERCAKIAEEFAAGSKMATAIAERIRSGE